MDDINKSKSTPPWLDVFPRLRDIEDPIGRGICESVKDIITLEPGSTVFREGDPCEAYLLCIEGSIRVYKTSPDGRELMLYRVHAGQSCALTTGCLLSEKPYPASSVTEISVRAVAISRQDFFRGMTESAGFSNFVLNGYGDQLLNLISLVRGLAFDRLDIRIAECLLAESESEQEIFKTHAGLAAELGSVREVISRELKHMKDKGWIDVKRGSILILDRNALSQLVLSHFA